MHKPVHFIKRNCEIDAAVLENKSNALRVALLLLPRVFSELDLYLEIASLSYMGDFAVTPLTDVMFD